MLRHGWDRIPTSIQDDIDQVRANRLLYALGAATAVLHVWFNAIGLIDARAQNIIHFACFALLCGWMHPLIAPGRARIADRLFTVAVAIGALYLIPAEDWIYQRGVRLAPADWIIGALVIVGAIEFTRRTTGWIIPILIVLALSYITWWGDLIDGVFRFGGLKTETLLFRSLFGDDALFGAIARISSTFVFMFILFGAFLLRSGAGDFVVHLAHAIAGRLVGGPGIVAVIASGLTGTISGSAIANTASTGVVTIPMMKKAGFPPKFAAGVEAAASTGGQLMPPIMGAGAFVMASYTQIDYSVIVAVSILPALLYFCSLAFYVRSEAHKQRITRPPGPPPAIGPLILREGLSFIIPVALLIGMLVAGFTPVYASAFAILAVIVTSWFTPTKMGPKAVLDALALGARNMVMTAMLLCAVGLIINVIATAGIGNTFSLMITDWAGGSLLLAIALVALASLILGMGLPVTAAYIVLATLSAPALYNLMANIDLAAALAAGDLSADAKTILLLAAPELSANLDTLTRQQTAAAVASLPPETITLLQPQLINAEKLTLLLLSAHMIIFWLSQDSNVTPPVCLCSFTAAAIAKTPPMATGFASWKIAKSLYLIPLLFAYTPLLWGNWAQMLEVTLFALLGLYAFTCAIQGWSTVKLPAWARLLMAITAAGLLWPAATTVHLAFGALLAGLMWITARSSGDMKSR